MARTAYPDANSPDVTAPRQVDRRSGAGARPVGAALAALPSLLRRLLAGIAVFALAVPAPAGAGAAADRAAEYQRLQAWRAATAPIAVPEGGLSWSVETADFTLESGRVWLLEPTASGAASGLVFEGKGRFEMMVPDAGERRQLARFAEREGLEHLEEPFDQMVLRASGGPPLDGLGLPADAALAPHGLAAERFGAWLRLHGTDADARIIAAATTPAGRFLRADVKTASFGWLTFDYDTARLEEVHLDVYHPRYNGLERWLSLDRAEDRRPDGAAGAAWRPPADVEHVDISARLARAGKSGGGLSIGYTLIAEISARVRLRPEIDGAASLPLELHPLARVESVTGANGAALPFLRRRIGVLSASLDDRLHDESLLVLFDQPLTRGEQVELVIEYELELANFAPGRSWYPGVEGLEVGLADLHTGRLAIAIRDDHEVRAMGVRESETVADKLRTSIWRIDQPVRMLTFCFAKDALEETVTMEGVPEVAAFGSHFTAGATDKFFNIAADVSNSLGFYQRLMGAPLGDPHLTASVIAASHGQAFRGFLHLADVSAMISSPGATQLFRGHEVAHQWWGHGVGWASYRDQWISEAFAEYFAMVFVEATEKNGPAFFREILEAKTDELTGSLESSFSRFTRPGLAYANRGARRVGPIELGYRASTADTPSGYFSQVYTRGALVIHMLRGVLRLKPGGEELFWEIVRGFYREHAGGVASTADLEAAVERRTGAEWSWFFDQWVRGTAIPVYDWNAGEGGRTPDGEHVVRLTVRQSEVPEGFRMPVPVRMEFSGGRSGQLAVVVDQAEETFELPVPEKPSKVVFNPDFAVLARTRKR